MQEKKRNEEKYMVKNCKHGMKNSKFISNHDKFKWIKSTYYEIFSSKILKIQLQVVYKRPNNEKHNDTENQIVKGQINMF